VSLYEVPPTCCTLYISIPKDVSNKGTIIMAASYNSLYAKADINRKIKYLYGTDF
jgi:hypothetical protein